MLGQLLRMPLRLLPPRTVTRILSGPARGMRWVIGASNHGCWIGTYERHTQKVLTEIIRPGDIVLDIGANVGFYTLLAARLVGSSGLVIAFEPFEPNIQQFERHVALNGLSWVRLERSAVGERT